MKEKHPFSGGMSIILLVLIPVSIGFSLYYFPAQFTSLTCFLRDDVRNPLWRSICLTAGKIDFSGRHEKYITRTDLNEIKKELKPGDIILRRNEDQFTNMAISGFWTHSGIYIGGGDEIDEYFGNLIITGGKKPSEYIEQNYPVVFRKMALKRHLIIEAVGEGVSVSSINHFANSDYFSAVRAMIDKETLFKVLLAAFDNYGKPYDFFFDFQNDDSFFCSELIYKSFSVAGMGTLFDIQEADGDTFLTPNDIALQAIDDKTSSGFQFVVFYCADEHMKRAYKKNRSEFRMYAFD